MKQISVLVIMVFCGIANAQNVFTQSIHFPLGINKWVIKTTYGKRSDDPDCVVGGDVWPELVVSDWFVELVSPCPDTRAARQWLNEYQTGLEASLEKTERLSRYLYEKGYSARIILALLPSDHHQFRKSYYDWDLPWQPLFLAAIAQINPGSDADKVYKDLSSLQDTVSHELFHAILHRHNKNRLTARENEAIAWTVGYCGSLLGGNLTMEDYNTPSMKKQYLSGRRPEEAFETTALGKNFLREYGKDNGMYSNLLGYVDGRWNLWRLFGTQLEKADSNKQKNILKYCRYLVQNLPNREEMFQIEKRDYIDQPDPPDSLLSTISQE